MELSLNGVLKNNYVINKIIIKIIPHMIYFKRKRKELCTFVVACLWVVICNSVKRWTSSILSISYTEGQKNGRSSTDWSSQVRVSLCFHQWGCCKDEEMKWASLLPVDKLWKLYAESNKSHIKEQPDCITSSYYSNIVLNVIMWNLEKMVQMHLFAKQKQRYRCREQTLSFVWIQRWGEGRWDEKEVGIDTFMLMLICAHAQ